MPELIDRQALLEKMRDCEAVTHSIGYLDVIAIIQDAPTIKCTEMEWICADGIRYCACCGAKMKEDKDAGTD